MNAHLLRYLSTDQMHQLAAAVIGIAGAGGLGSNCAVMLCRSGIGRIVLIDGDIVEPSNLNRQYYLPKHIGMPKAKALASQLRELAPWTKTEAITAWIRGDTIAPLLDKAHIWVEAMDRAPDKAMFVAKAMSAGKTVISGNGLAGIGRKNMERRVMHSKNGAILAAVGDFESDICNDPPMAPRVMQCAAMQADAVLEYVFTGDIKAFH